MLGVHVRLGAECDGAFCMNCCGPELEFGSHMAGEHSGIPLPAGWPWASCFPLSEAQFPHLQDVNSISPALEGC